MDTVSKATLGIPWGQMIYCTYGRNIFKRSIISQISAIMIPLYYGLYSLIDNRSTVFQLMAWCRQAAHAMN